MPVKAGTQELTRVILIARLRYVICVSNVVKASNFKDFLLEAKTYEVDIHCRVDSAGDSLLRKAIARLDLSARSYHWVLKVARTIADLSGSEGVGATHIGEAIGYRRGLDTAG